MSKRRMRRIQSKKEEEKWCNIPVEYKIAV